MVGFLPEDRGPSSVCVPEAFLSPGLFPAQRRVWAYRQQRPPQGSLRSRKQGPSRASWPEEEGDSSLRF